jgi:hypothetical protein
MGESVGNQLPTFQQMLRKVSTKRKNVINRKISATKEIEHPHCYVGNNEGYYRGPVRLSLVRVVKAIIAAVRKAHWVPLLEVRGFLLSSLSGKHRASHRVL